MKVLIKLPLWLNRVGEVIKIEDMYPGRTDRKWYTVSIDNKELLVADHECEVYYEL